MADETETVKTDTVPENDTVPETPAETPAETPSVPEPAEDPSSEKEADAGASEPEVHIDPSELGDAKDASEAPSPEAENASEELSDPPLDPTPTPSESEEKASPATSSGSDAALESSPTQSAEEPVKAPESEEKAPEWSAPYGDAFDGAKSVVAFLGEDRVGDLKDAANALFHVFESLIDKDVTKLDGESSAILANVRNHGAGFLAATEAIFKRVR